MSQPERLKYGWAPVFLILLTFIVSTFLFFFRIPGTGTAILCSFCGVLFFYFLELTAISRDFRMIFAAIFMLNLGLAQLAWSYGNKNLESIFRAGSMLFAYLSMFLLFTHSFKPNFRQIFELAAEPIEEEMNGFTTRPYPAGKLKYTKEEIIEFAKFLKRKFISLSYVEDDRIYLVLKTSEIMVWIYILYYKPDYSKDTYVMFDFDGNVTVQISKKDYERLKWEISFDQLCESMGNLFKLFFHYFQDREEQKIIQTLNWKLAIPYNLYRHPKKNVNLSEGSEAE